MDQLIINRCVMCKKKFNAKTIYQKTCGLTCLSNSYNKRCTYGNCDYCNRVYKTRLNTAKKNKGFCSVSCRMGYNITKGKRNE